MQLQSSERSAVGEASTGRWLLIRPWVGRETGGCFLEEMTPGREEEGKGTLGQGWGGVENGTCVITEDCKSMGRSGN